MAARDSILLIIKQAKSIDYNTLLNRVSANYGSLNSARAALSRTLKDLNAFGLIQRRKNTIYITDKGAAQISLEMKSKLLTKLNQALKSKNRLQETDEIVTNLHTLIERSKNDADLLKAARGSVEFKLADLERLNERVKKQSSHLAYINKVLSGQINSLKELGFNDVKAITLTDEGLKEIERIFSTLHGKEFSLQSNDKKVMESLAQHFAKKSDREINVVNAKNCLKAIKTLQSDFAGDYSSTHWPLLKVYAANFVFKFTPSTAYVIGPASELQGLFQKKK